MVYLSKSLACAAALTAPAACWWMPSAGTTFNIDLSGQPTKFSPNTTFSAYDVDMVNTANATIKSLHDSGHKVICYFSAGTLENYRNDVGTIPKSAIGKELQDWPGEYWLDTRNAEVRNVMTKRIALAQAKGCDAIDPDNVDGYDNDSGLPLTQDTAVDYVNWLAGQAHKRGMAAGLKNAKDIVPRVISNVEFCVNEQCAAVERDETGETQRECDGFQPFIKAKKPVFEIEYVDGDDENQKTPTAAFLKQTCQNAHNKGFTVLIKNLDLDTYTARCPTGKTIPF